MEPDNEHVYIPYAKAFQLLKTRLQATPEELAGWIFLGEENGGIAAYLNANEEELARWQYIADKNSEPFLGPPRFHFNIAYASDFLSPITGCWFKANDIARFQPGYRFITCQALLDRWGTYEHINVESFIRAKIRESRLFPIPMLLGAIKGSYDISDPLIELSLFDLNEVKKIEEEDGLLPTPKTPIDFTIAAETRCKEWLAKLMKEPKEKSKSDYLAEAKSEFNVSARGFIRAWDSAVRESGSKKEWIKPGPISLTNKGK